MKRTIVASVLTGMTFTLIAPMAMADRGESLREPGARMEMMDVNDDGQITLEEARGALAARFAKLDINGNGALSQSEMGKRAPAKAAERFARLDADGDGEISLAELPGDRVARVFDRLDANDDGILSTEELDTTKDMRGKRAGKGNRRH